jgi:predicted nucleic acid-binding protein
LIVLDASAAVELFVLSEKAERVARRIGTEKWCAPHLFDIEVLQGLRRLLRLEEIDEYTARLAIDSLFSASIRRFDHEALAPRIWELRENVTAYDAAYVALAELLEAPLVTCDKKLGAAPRHRARVEVL